MSITTLLSKDFVFIKQSYSDKMDFVEKATDILVSKGICIDKQKFLEDVKNRENLSSTDLA